MPCAPFMITGIPSMTYDSSVCCFSSNPSTYDNPEQPPPFTPIRNCLPAFSSNCINFFISAAAEGVSETGADITDSIFKKLVSTNLRNNGTKNKATRKVQGSRHKKESGSQSPQLASNGV